MPIDHAKDLPDQPSEIQETRPSPRYLRLTVALVLVIAAAGVAYAVTHSGGRFYSDGPLFIGYPSDTSESGSTADVGGQVIWGNITLVNNGTQPLTLMWISLNPDGDVSGTRIDAIYIIDIEKHQGYLIGMDRVIPSDYDTADNMRPVAGYVVTPKGSSQVIHRGEYQMLVEVTVTKAGTWVFSSYSVYYQMGGRSYVAEHGDGLRICAPMQTPCGP